MRADVGEIELVVLVVSKGASTWARGPSEKCVFKIAGHRYKVERLEKVLDFCGRGRRNFEVRDGKVEPVSDVCLDQLFRLFTNQGSLRLLQFAF